MTTAHRVCGALLFIALIGCSGPPPKADVSGQITLAGKEPKLGGLQIAFRGPDGNIVVADIGEDGRYNATGVTPGEAKVFFTSVTQEQAEMAAQVKEKHGRLQKPGGAPAAKVAASNLPKANPIPPKFRDPTSSPLAFAVEGGKPNTFDYDIRE